MVNVSQLKLSLMVILCKLRELVLQEILLISVFEQMVGHGLVSELIEELMLLVLEVVHHHYNLDQMDDLESV